MMNDSTSGPRAGRPARAAWVTPIQVALLGFVALLCGFGATAYWPQTAARAQGRGGFPGGPPGPGGFGGMQQERKILAQFDEDKNKRLSLDERQAAREWLATQPMSGPGGRRGGRGFGRGFATASPGKRLSPDDVKSYQGAALYDPATLRTIFLQFEEADWEQALADFKNTDVEVPATVIVDGKTYKDVGVHFRGMSSYMMVPEGAKRSLNLSFDFAHDNQALGGYRTLNLLNANGDATFVRAVLYSEIAREYIPAPRINYMRTVINGESWGIYLNAQQFNKDFLRDNFSTEKGARWKVPGSPGGRGGMEYLGDDVCGYKRIYEIKTKDDPKAWADLIRLFKVLNDTPPEKLEAALAPILDVDATLKFLAARRRARQQRRVLDPRERLQHLRGRERPLPRDPARHERRARGRGRRLRRPCFWRPTRRNASSAARMAVPRRKGLSRRQVRTRRRGQRAAGSPRRRERFEQGAAIPSAFRSGAPRPVHDLRPRDRGEMAGLEEARADRSRAAGADCGGREERHPEALQHRGVCG